MATSSGFAETCTGAAKAALGASNSCHLHWSSPCGLGLENKTKLANLCRAFLPAWSFLLHPFTYNIQKTS
ncbi:hypothetical protein I79_010421 [Cricetulus griseus]|uniref:Uncharacterized protein n=1 Tax=Cricetulus griseus TaxID=10029 RepID=G3HIB6_CRIGR|nr:hypothetical protein I79_010421 [Cricetulus griseus]